jgi:hypothetical protein
MNGVVLVLAGVAALAVLSIVVRAHAGVRRARAAAEIARAGTGPVSLIGRTLVTALGIVGVQWLVITHSPDVTLWWMVLGAPALVTAYVVTRATTVMQIGPSRRQGGQR